MNTNHNHERNDTGSSSNRPMSVSEIKDSYDEFADGMRRLEWL